MGKAKNKIDLTLSPDEVFFNPGADRGFGLLSKPAFYWRPQPAGTIVGFSVSAHAEIDKKITDYLRQTKRHRRFAKAIEFNAVPVVLDDASFRKSSVLVKEKVLLNGAPGYRALNRYRWDNTEEGFDPAQALTTYFDDCQTQNAAAALPVYAGAVDADFAVVCRNTFNYFHFVTEALCQLTLLDPLEFQGQIYFHFPNSEDKQRGFAQAFVEALFPEYYGRVHFERAPKDYDQVLTAYDLQGAFYQYPERTGRSVDDHAPSGQFWKGKDYGVGAQSILAMNSYSSALSALRKRALAAIEGQDFTHLPTRFFVGRDDRYSRQRFLGGEDLLFEHLDLFNFDYVVFESMTPLEQIALMANAEMMISYHGAGFTNMLFANHEAHVIEIGTLQTAKTRWGDFWPLAHVSGCKYVNFFGDFRAEDPLLEPNFDKDGIVPGHLSSEAVGQIMAFVVTLFDQYAEYPDATRLARVAQQVFDIGAVEQANELLEVNAELVKPDATLCLLKADCHKHFDEPKSELIFLEMATKADPARWQTLIRLIWCANRCKMPEVIKWALARLKADFPDRHDAFVGNHDWVRFVA